MKTYDVMIYDRDQDGYVQGGTITLDEAGKIAFTATPGNEEWMQRLVGESVLVEGRRLTADSDGPTWFEWLPRQRQSSTLYFDIPIEPPAPVSPAHQ
jgi:hypothetical protein